MTLTLSIDIKVDGRELTVEGEKGVFPTPSFAIRDFRTEDCLLRTAELAEMVGLRDALTTIIRFFSETPCES